MRRTRKQLSQSRIT